MKSIKLVVSIVSFLLMQIQGVSQSTDCVKNINAHIWSNFTISFETFDLELFKSLHTENFIRASGNSKSLKDKKTYINGYKKTWESPKIKQTISFRFLERFCDGKTASERGIYKLTINPDRLTEKSYFGQFHVILIKVKDQWKFLVDYDSDENNTINENSYNRAFALDNYEKF